MLYIISTISQDWCSGHLQCYCTLSCSLYLSLYLSVFNHHYFSYFMDQYRSTDEVHPCISLCYTQPPLAQDHWVGALLKKLSFPSRDSVVSVVKEPSGSSQGAEVVSSAGEGGAPHKGTRYKNKHRPQQERSDKTLLRYSEHPCPYEVRETVMCHVAKNEQHWQFMSFGSFFSVLQKRCCKWLNHHHMCNQTICLSFQPTNINSKILTVVM